MEELQQWVAGQRKRLKSGRLSRAEYEKALSLCAHLGAELQVVYIILEDANPKELSGLCRERAARVMKLAGVR